VNVFVPDRVTVFVAFALLTNKPPVPVMFPEKVCVIEAVFEVGFNVRTAPLFNAMSRPNVCEVA
jgi:hypothetical protein